MLDFSRIQNYYIACGYTDMRKQIDGLAAVVELQFGKKHPFSCSADIVRIGSKRCTGTAQDTCCFTNGSRRSDSSGPGMSRN